MLFSKRGDGIHTKHNGIELDKEAKLKFITEHFNDFQLGFQMNLIVMSLHY